MKPSAQSIAKYFPYPEFRPYQREAISFLYEVFLEGNVGLLSSPCGTGKSISALTAYLAAREKDEVGKLFVLTRTKSQMEIYCRELVKMKEEKDVGVVAAFFQSKVDMCPLIRDLKLEKMRYEDFYRLCKSLKEGKDKRCPYYEETYYRWKPSARAKRLVQHLMIAGPMLPEEVFEYARAEGLCPHEIMKILAEYADIFVGNYNYVLMDPVRKAMLSRAKVGPEDLNVVFDEAHSLPEYCIDLLSRELSTTSVKRAFNEAKNYKTGEESFFEALQEAMRDLGKEAEELAGLDKPKLVDRQKLASALKERLKLSSFSDLEQKLEDLLELGERIASRKMDEGKRPVSYVYSVASFLEAWIHSIGTYYAHYVYVEGGEEKRIKLGIKALDPGLAVGDLLKKFRSVVLMSGTLWNFDYYVDVLNLKGSSVKRLELPSPFPKENRLVIADLSVTTKYEKRSEAMFEKIAERLDRLVEAISGRVAVYFPSYAILQTVLAKMKNGFPKYVEGKKVKLREVLDFAKRNSKCLLLGVARGKLSEGVDLAHKGRSLLNAVIIVGLPYPEKTELQEAVLKYYEEKYGNKAFEYAYMVPCANAIAQAAGRLLRSPHDRGVVVIMDSRVVGKIKEKLPKQLVSEMARRYKLENILKDIESFKRLSVQPSSTSS